MQRHIHTEVYVDSIRKHITNHQRSIVLIEKQGRRCMPVWIDDHIAYSLTQTFQHQRDWPLPLHNLRDGFEAVPQLGG